MKVTLINTFQSSGGAAVACNRLLQALKKHGTDVTLLVQEKAKEDPNVIPVAQTWLTKKMAFGRFVLDRLFFFFQEKSKQVRFAFSPANIGIDISQHPIVQQSDILHLHWVYFGFLSTHSPQKLIKLNKTIVWTLHDMWAFTGGCHYSGTCQHYQTHCHSCPFLKNPHPKDLSYQVFEQKLALFAHANITFVTCSEWLAQLARKSALLKNFRIVSIPNPIDTNLYKPIDRVVARKRLGLDPTKKLILFGAMNTTDPRKGFAYLSEALHKLKESHPPTVREIELVIFGKADKEALAQLPYHVNDLGQISGNEALVNTYNACDSMVLPSLEDNLPNTVMEPLSCGTPVVAFDTGGLPEMIDHQSDGYLANYKSAEDLARGIYWLLYQAGTEQIRKNARQKVMQHFTESIIAQKYVDLYRSLLS